MEKTKKGKWRKPKGATGVQSPHAIFPKPLPAFFHGQYIDLSGVDMRTRPGQAAKKLTLVLLERFPSPAPAAAQLLAQRAAFKLIRAASFEAFILKGGKAAARAESDYIGLTESIRKDLQALWVMAKDNGNVKDPVPNLHEYVEEAIKNGKLHPVEAIEVEKVTDDPVTIEEEQPKASATLF